MMGGFLQGDARASLPFFSGAMGHGSCCHHEGALVPPTIAKQCKTRAGERPGSLNFFSDH